MAILHVRTRAERSRLGAQFPADASHVIRPLQPDQDAQGGHRLQRLGSIDAHEAATEVKRLGVAAEILSMMVNLSPVVTDMSESHNLLYL
jgi:hypothetical protein